MIGARFSKRSNYLCTNCVINVVNRGFLYLILHRRRLLLDLRIKWRLVIWYIVLNDRRSMYVMIQVIPKIIGIS